MILDSISFSKKRLFQVFLYEREVEITSDKSLFSKIAANTLCQLRSSTCNFTLTAIKFKLLC